MPGHRAWPELRRWWLKHERGANTPNWDIAMSCDVENKPGLILVEAKANVPELSEAGKWVWSERSKRQRPSVRSQENHTHIKLAIETARDALSRQFPGSKMAIDRSYQLSNRLAFAWKLASLGVPTVLIYLGFIGDTYFPRPFQTAEDWHGCFADHLTALCPGLPCERRIETDDASFWILSRARSV